MALLGSQASVHVAGDAVALTGEPLSLVAGAEYQITNAAKRALDPATAIKVFDGAAEVGAATYAVDYAHGVVTLGSVPSGAVTLDGAYLPLLSVAEARAVDVDSSYETADVSRFGDTADRLLPTRSKCGLTLEHLHAATEDLDGGSGTKTFRGMLGTTVFIEVDEGSEKLRGWFLLKSNKTSIKLTDAIGKTVEAQGVVQTCAGRSEQALFSWR